MASGELRLLKPANEELPELMVGGWLEREVIISWNSIDWSSDPPIPAQV